MERELSRSGRCAVARAALAGVLVLGALPAMASADKPADTPGNGPPATAGNSGHAPGNPGHGPKAHAQAPAHADHVPQGRAVRAHGAPSHSGGNSAQEPRAHSHAQPHTAAPAPRSQQHSNNGAAHQKTPICHATGSATNPYVEITISDRALKAHARHQDGRDIIPAPPGGCPGAAGASTRSRSDGVGAAAQTASPGAATAGTGSTSRNGAQPDSGVAGVVATKRTVAAGDAGDSPAGSVAAADRSHDGSLPFTGLNLALALLIAAGLVLAGVALRRAAGRRHTAA